MTDRNDGDATDVNRADMNRTDSKRDRFDALVSASMDDELDLAGRAELERLMSGRASDHASDDASGQASDHTIGEASGEKAGDDTLTARVRALHHVDASLRALAADSVSEARLAANFERLRARLANRRSPRRIRVSPIVLAAAAALALYLLVPDRGRDEPNVVIETDTREAGAGEAETEITLALEEELAWALGVVDHPSDAGEPNGDLRVLADDFEIIEQLDVLEFLAARASEGRG